MKKLLLPLVILALLFPSAIPALAGDPDPELTSTPALADEPTPSLESPRPRWQQLFPPVSPSPRASHAMAYDTARGVAVLFGGSASGTEVNDTWEWDSASMTWTERQPAHRPSVRLGAAMAYDAARGVTVLFGGTTGIPDFNDTWLWDGSDWTQVFPVNSPPARWAHSMVFDSQRQVIVLFGGINDGYHEDTWEWDGTNWTEQPISGPSPRCCAGMAYDRHRNVTVLFGGNDSFTFFQDTWERVGAGAWQEVFPTRHPSARERPGMAYFPRLRQVVLFGGERIAFNDDTFLWNGQRWRTRTYDPRPAGRCCMGMVYDSVLRGVLLFGGSVSFVQANDTWLFR